MKLKNDIYNLMNKKQLYAHAGDEVVMIGAVLVMTKDGSKFPVNAKDLEESGGKKPPDPSKKAPAPPEKKPVKRAPLNKKPRSTKPPTSKVQNPNNSPSLF